MTKRFWLAAGMIGSAVACVLGAELSGEYDFREASEGREEKILEYLRPVAESSDKAIRLYYRGLPCRSQSTVGRNGARYAPIPFPFVQAQPASKPNTGLAAVQEIFAKDDNVTVTEKPFGIIRIIIGHVPTEILQTKISHIRLRTDAQFNQWVAIYTIVYSKEMKEAARRLRVAPVSGTGGLVGAPEKGASHLPRSLSNLTVDQALDLIAKTFSSIVTYGACAEPANSDGTKPFWID